MTVEPVRRSGDSRPSTQAKQDTGKGKPPAPAVDDVDDQRRVCHGLVERQRGGVTDDGS